ncbi:hypothetical protein YWIDRAFT_00615 [Streptomyces sp. SceaMP-e96]|nr:hypothetical protein YWIDRAFT_00615 [Streptomyces sp. SceaMP-e96]
MTTAVAIWEDFDVPRPLPHACSGQVTLNL